jgi:hypothetical protein
MMMRIGLMTLLAFALAVAGAQAQPPVGRPEAAGAPGAQQAEPPAAVIDRLPISIEAIKDGIERAPEPPSALRIGPLPTFRVTVYGQRRQLLPDFKETLRQPWQAPIPGGIHNKEIMDLITPPTMRPFGAFTNGDLAEVAGTALVSALAGRALYKGYTAARGALRGWREERIREEVEAELEAFKRANGIVDPGAPTPLQSPPKPPGSPQNIPQGTPEEK